MFERFTDRARKTMALANQEAQRWNHEYIGTEHILLGLLKEGSGVGAHVLKNLGVDLVKVRREVEQLVKRGPETVQMGKLPQTPRAKRVIEYAIEEARSLNHNYVGTEHMLLGLLREPEGIAAHVLMNLGVSLQAAREETLQLLGAPYPVAGGHRRSSPGAKPPADDATLDSLCQTDPAATGLVALLRYFEGQHAEALTPAGRARWAELSSLAQYLAQRWHANLAATDDTTPPPAAGTT